MVTQALERIPSEFGGLDFLVNSTAVGLCSPVETYSLDNQQTMATNVTRVFLYRKAAIPLLRQRSDGQIITISSGAGKRGYANLAVYSTSKFAVMASWSPWRKKPAHAGSNAPLWYRAAS